MIILFRPFFVLALPLLALSLLAQSPRAFSSPKLVLLVSIDQLSAGRLSADMTGGLGRLMRQGRVYSKAMLDHGQIAMECVMS